MNPLINAYWKLINGAKKKMPNDEELVKLAYHLGIAVKEVGKGFDSLKRKDIQNIKAKKKSKKIVIE